MVTTQNIFQSENKLFIRNASERVVFYNKGDENYLTHLSSQMKVGNPRFLANCFTTLFAISHRGIFKIL
jgi:hypothetical protein